MKQKTIFAIFNNVEKIVIGQSKKPVEELTARLIEKQYLRFDSRIPFIEKHRNFMRISNDDAIAVIRTVLSPEDRIALSDSQIKECYRRLMIIPELDIAISEKFWEQQHYLNLLDGVYNILTMDKVTNWRECCFDYQLMFRYIRNSKLENAPTFQKFVESSIGTENLECLLRSMGYCLSSLTKGRKCFVLKGYGQTGKSTLLNLLESVIPPELVSHEPFHTMASMQSKAKYPNMRINISRENSSIPMRHEDSFKSLISCEMTTGREVFEKSIDFVPTLKFIFATNNDLNFAHPDDAVYDRIVVIPFTRKIPDDQRDPYLDEKLEREKDIIFSMAVDTLNPLIHSNYDFCMSEEAMDYLGSRREQLHTVSDFLDDKCKLDENGVISSVELNQQYEKWCRANNLSPTGRNDFYQQVRAYDPSISKKRHLWNGDNVNCFLGLCLKKDNSKPETKGKSNNESSS